MKTFSLRPLLMALCILPAQLCLAQAPYPVPDTGQSACFNSSSKIACPAQGAAFAGQDAQQQGTPMSYTDNGDGTVSDQVTGLMWMKSPDLNGDGKIGAADKLSYADALAFAKKASYGGHSDWRLPTIKEMYSLMNFDGVDVSGWEGSDTSGLIPFLNTQVFDFGYGDVAAGERIIDSQMASSTRYVASTVPNEKAGTLFGVNFADGRIKGYGLELFGKDKTFYIMLVRGKTGYGENAFTDHGNGTLTDTSTGLMWTQNDSGKAMSWQDALAWAQRANAEKYLGHSDWRLPNVKELQILVDYSRSPSTTDSAAINPMFKVTPITNEAGQKDYPAYWSSTTHQNWTKAAGSYASYVSFGRAMGFMEGKWADVHGAGAQRSDLKTGKASDFPQGEGPQGDAMRINNYARLVRDAS